MKTTHRRENAICEIEHLEIPMRDGALLAARIWMPAAPVPAILEYLPYRKNDLTHGRDAPMQSYLASHGYAVVRLDLRGAGESQGVLLDEYLEQELQDGEDAISWIAKQPWCDGQLGMVGNSWGGFNSLQIAARRPAALKAIVTVCSTDDRYGDDVHYMGGCLLGEQLSWASVMLGRNTLPPDPRHVGADWRSMWQKRLEGSGLWLENWLQHQTRDGFWRHGSICENYADIAVPVLAASGWADGYCRSVFRLMENLKVPRLGIIGPWAHGYAHTGRPGPAIGFLQEELRWWDHWLKGRDTGIMAEPVLRLYMQESVAPKGGYEQRPGRWVAEPSWPSPNVTRQAFHLGAGRELRADESGKAVLEHATPLDMGMAAGKWCSYGLPGDGPLDQRREDAGSLCFETAPLVQSLEMAGDAVLTLRLAVDQPVAHLVARLVDVAPNGQATRVSFGVLNLTHRAGHETPRACVPGEVMTVRLDFKHVAQQFGAGHRLRLAISSHYFPMIWPAPHPVILSVHTQGSFLELPLRAPCALDEKVGFGAPEMGPQMQVEQIQEGENHWRIVQDAISGVHEMQIAESDGEYRILHNDLTVFSQGYETYSIDPDDIGSATGVTQWEYRLSRGDWQMRSLSETTLTADVDDFIISASVEVWEGETLCHRQSWDRRIPRQLV